MIGGSVEKQEKKKYPYVLKDNTIQELELIKSMSSCREYNVFHDYNYIIYNLVSQLLKYRKEGDK